MGQEIKIQDENTILEYLASVDAGIKTDKVSNEVDTEPKVREGNSINTKIVENTSPSLSLMDTGSILTGEGYRPIAIQVLNEESVKLPKIIDTTGSISASIIEIEKALSCSVLPFSVTRIAPCVMNLKDHDIVKFDGELYSSNNSSSTRLDIVDEYVNRVVESFEKRGKAFTLNLMTVYKNGIYNFVTCLFNSFELKYIVTRLASLRVKVYEHETTGHMQLVVGDFY